MVPAAGAGSGNAVLIDVEGHGREEIFPGIELSRTVGWFTSLYPVRLDPGPLDIEEAMAGGPALGRALKLIKEQLHAVPDNGLGYGLLRYLNPQTSVQLRGLARPQWASTIWAASPAAAATDWGVAGEADALGGGGDPAMRLAHLLEVNALTLDGRDGRDAERHLVVGAGAVGRSRGARAGARLVPGAGGAGAPCGAARGRRPHAFAICPRFRSRRPRSSGWSARYPQIEDILPLSPLQEGLLFHALYGRRGRMSTRRNCVSNLQGALDERHSSAPCRRCCNAMPACAPASSTRT